MSFETDSKAVDALVRRMWSGFADEDDDIDFHDPARVAAIRSAAWFPYICVEHRDAAMRTTEFADLELDVYDHVGRTDLDWIRFERLPMVTTESESITTSEEYAERAFLLERTILHLRSIRAANVDVEQKAVDEIKRRFPSAGSLLQYAPAQSELRLFQGPEEKQHRWRRANQLNGLARELVQHLRGLF